MRDFLLISAGAVVGANLRYWVVSWFASRAGDVFPYGTLVVNLTGSFLLGILLTLLGARMVADSSMRLLVGTGILGAYTTFSAFSYETIVLLQRGDWAQALLNSGGNLFGSVLAAYLGVLAVQLFVG